MQGHPTGIQSNSSMAYINLQGGTRIKLLKRKQTLYSSWSELHTPALSATHKSGKLAERLSQSLASASGEMGCSSGGALLASGFNNTFLQACHQVQESPGHHSDSVGSAAADLCLSALPASILENWDEGHSGDSHSIDWHSLTQEAVVLRYTQTPGRLCIIQTLCSKGCSSILLLSHCLWWHGC